MPRIPRLLTRRPRPAAILAAGAATLFLGILGTIGASDATPADIAPHTDTVTAYNDGWADGRADLMGDDNRDGRVDEDETGAEQPCRGEVEFADVCATVAERPAYAWTDDDGTPHTVAAGRSLLSRIDAVPGTEEFAAALFALDAQWFEHNQP
ncbi:hypothetical protein ACFWCA_19120 [Streptomyces phaeochromogenes]|uniref:hypothetical protein n=1 Tax=Streptomyces phaeochromogenes TaxID=1923 RepID=UPI0036AA0ECA